MSQTKPMTTLRRPMPGMPADGPPPESASPTPPSTRRPLAADTEPATPPRRRRVTHTEAAPTSAASTAPERWSSSDYASTRLANFRLPIDLHDHYRELVRQVERAYPRLRRPSLTEVIVALLEEGPQTPEQVVELLRRRRAAENAQEASS